MKYKLNKVFKFGWKGIKGWSYNSKDDFSNASAAYFEVTGRHGKIKTTHSDRIYYILDGKGEFIINDEVLSVTKTDVIIVPKDTPYDYRAIGGVMKLYLVHSPAFEPDAEVKLEKYEHSKSGRKYE